jgi:hypothetical protein
MGSEAETGDKFVVLRRSVVALHMIPYFCQGSMWASRPTFYDSDSTSISLFLTAWHSKTGAEHMSMDNVDGIIDT